MKTMCRSHPTGCICSSAVPGTYQEAYKCGLILESGEPREVHHFATLLGYGACAINPYLAQDTIEQLVDDHLLDKDYYAAINDYNSAVLHGIVKIASKMGISTIQSYQGSKIFEAIGIDRSVIDKYFTDTVSRIGGITISDIENDVNELHSMAFDPLGLQTELTLDSKGHHKMRSGAQKHLYNPQTIHLLAGVQQNVGIMIYLKSIQSWSTMRPTL